MTTRDAVGNVFAHAYARKGTRPRDPKLWYFESEDAAKPAGATGAELEREVRRLEIIFPDRVH